MTADLLTEDEHTVLDLSGQIADLLVFVVADGPTRDADLTEAFAHIHVLQNMVLAQAAARAYPDRYRPMGGVIAVTEV